MPFCLLAQAHRRSPPPPRSIRTNALSNADSFVNATLALFINTEKATTIQTTITEKKAYNNLCAKPSLAEAKEEREYENGLVYVL